MDIVERLRVRNTPYGHTELMDKAADEIKRLRGDGDLRMLGTRDGLAHALIWVHGQIARIDGPYSPRIHPLHKKKRAARDAILQPLIELQERIAKAHREITEAYEKTREQRPAREVP